MKLPVPTVLAAVLLSAAFTASHAQSEGTLAKVKATKTITIGNRDTSLPFSYKVGDGKDPIGFTNDICLKIVDAVKQKLGLDDIAVRYTTLTSTNRIPLIQNGTADLDCATTTNTLARAEQVDFAPSHFVATITVATRKDSGIRSLADLGNKTVATVAGSTSIQLLRNYRRNENVEVREISGKDPSEAFLLMSSGRADAYVLDDVQLASMIATSGQADAFVMLKESLREEPYGIMFLSLIHI